MNKVKNVCDFYAITHKLKNLLRSGMVDCGVQSQRLESVAEHVYGTQMLALAISAEFNFQINIERVALMLAIHELGECIIGDLPATGCPITKEEKKRIEMEAVVKILSELNNADYIKNLYIEFDAQETREAKFSMLVDKLENDFQCKYHEELGELDMDKLKPRTQAQAERIKNRRDEGYKRFCDFWIGNDIKKFFENDEVFNAIAKYLLNNNVFN